MGDSLSQVNAKHKTSHMYSFSDQQAAPRLALMHEDNKEEEELHSADGMELLEESA